MAEAPRTEMSLCLDQVWSVCDTDDNVRAGWPPPSSTCLHKMKDDSGMRIHTSLKWCLQGREIHLVHSVL